MSTPSDINRLDDATFQNHPHAQIKSDLTIQELKDIWTRFQIPSSYILCLATAEERIYHRPDGLWIGFNPQILQYGVRFLLPSFLNDLLIYLGIDLSQLVHNSFIHINCFIAHCHQLQVSPNIAFFSQYFSIGGSKLPPTKNFILRRSAQSWMPTPTSNKVGTTNGLSLVARSSSTYPTGPTTMFVRWTLQSPKTKGIFSTFCSIICWTRAGSSALFKMKNGYMWTGWKLLSLVMPLMRFLPSIKSPFPSRWLWTR